MKRCPECGREYDNTMMFCLDDGAELLYGPAKAEPPVSAGGFLSSDEPATAILSGLGVPPSGCSGSEPGAVATGFRGDEGRTAPFINTTDQTAILRSVSEAEPQKSLGEMMEKHRFWHKKRASVAEAGNRSANRAAKTLVALAVAAVVLIGGFFGYRYFAPAKQIESIAVMPFVNESGNADVEYLSDGMTETLIKSLSELPNLNVKPRSSVFRYKGKDTDLKTIGTELNVEAILNGRVVQRGEQLTLSLELIDVQNDKVLWTESYQRKQSDLVSLQSEIAKDVSTKLKLKLSGADEAKVTKTSTADPEAYQAYLKGRYYWNRRTAENLKKAIEQFKAATDRDPNYALAYAGLADCYVVLPLYAGTPTSETMPQAKGYAERAIAIDNQIAEPHASLGEVFRQSWQWAEAEREFKRAIELNPNYATAYQWYSELLTTLGRVDEAALMGKRAKELDPLSSVVSFSLSQIYLMQKDYNVSLQNSSKIIELDPNFPLAYVNLGLSYLKLGRNSEAIANFEKADELSMRDNSTLMYLGYAYAVTGKRPEAIAIVKELEQQYARKESLGVSIAAVYAGLGDKDKAFEWLEKDFQSRNGELVLARWGIPYESLRDDPRYKDLLRRMGLPE